MDKVQYATLSHCWGGTQPVVLTKGNFDAFAHDVPFASLPATFRDAIRLTLALGLEHIWIDSLCIIQDSREDWATEAQLMCDVYSHSWVNLAATSSRNCHGGLFRSSPLAFPCLIRASWSGIPSGSYLCLDETAWKRRIDRAPLNKRGWVLQERLLSPRIVHFAYDQIWWSCVELPHASESFPGGTSTGFWPSVPSLVDLLQAERDGADPDNDRAPWTDQWAAIVQAYTRTELTYGSDKLVALAGIAEAVSRIVGIPGTDYLAGLWAQDIVVDLLWRMANSGCRRAAEYRAPSWTWASTDGEIYMHSSDIREQNRRHTCARVVEHSTSPIAAAFGPVVGGQLKMSGPLIKLSRSDVDTSNSDEAHLQSISLDGQVFIHDSGFAEVLDDDRLYFEWDCYKLNVYYACLMASSEAETSEAHYKSEGLLVEAVSQEQGSFKRVGWLRTFHLAPYHEVLNKHVSNYTLI